MRPSEGHFRVEERQERIAENGPQREKAWNSVTEAFRNWEGRTRVSDWRSWKRTKTTEERQYL